MQSINPEVKRAYDDGMRLAKARDFIAALEQFNRALELSPDNHDILFNRANTLVRLKRDVEAVRDYDQALKLYPDDPDTLSNRGGALSRLGRYDEALRDYNRSLELRSDHAGTLHRRAITLAELKRYEEGLRDYNRSTEIRPDNADAFNNRGVLLDYWRKYEAAIESYDQAIQTAKQRGFSMKCFLLNRGRALYQLGKWRECQDSFEKAIEAYDWDAAAYNGLGIVMLAKNEVEAAVNNLTRAVELDSGKPLYHYNLAVALYRNGDKKRARGELQSAIDIAPEFELAKKALSYLVPSERSDFWEKLEGQPAPPEIARDGLRFPPSAN